MKTSELKAKLDNLFAEDVSSFLLEDAVNNAVRFYSRYNPRIVRTTLSLVEETMVYDLPAAFLQLDWFDWWPDGEASVTGTHNALWDTVYTAARSDMERARLSPFVRVVGNQLVLDVEPEADEDVEYSYFAAHVAVNDDYTTIPDGDGVMLLKLAAAELLEMKGMELSLLPDVAEGLLDIKHSRAAGKLHMTVAALRRETIARYGGL